MNDVWTPQFLLLLRVFLLHFCDCFEKTTSIVNTTVTEQTKNTTTTNGGTLEVWPVDVTRLGLVGVVVIMSVAITAALIVIYKQKRPREGLRNDRFIPYSGPPEVSNVTVKDLTSSRSSFEPTPLGIMSPNEQSLSMIAVTSINATGTGLANSSLEMRTKGKEQDKRRSSYIYRWSSIPHVTSSSTMNADMINIAEFDLAFEGLHTIESQGETKNREDSETISHSSNKISDCRNTGDSSEKSASDVTQQ